MESASGPKLGEGTYAAQAEQSDKAGNIGKSAPSTFTIKATGPVVSLTAVPSPTKNKTPSFGGAAGVAAGDIPSVTLKIYSGAVASGSPVRTVKVTPTGPTWKTSLAEALSDGTFTAQAEQSDEAGNTSTSTPSTFTVDTLGPAVSLNPVGSPKHTSKPSFSGHASTAVGDIRVVTLKIYAGSVASGSPVRTVVIAASSGTWEAAPLASPLKNGTYTAQAEQSDETGNVGKSEPPATFDLVSNGPIVSLTPVPSPSTDSTPSFSGSAAPVALGNSPVTLKIYPGAVASGNPVQTIEKIVPNGATWAAGPVSALPDGTYTAAAEQSDNVKPPNTGVSAEVTFTVDTTPPNISLTSSAAGSASSGGSQVLEGAAGTAPGDASTITIMRFAGTTVQPQALVETRVVQVSNGRWRVPFEGLALGTYTTQAEQSDEAGNTGRTQAVTFTIVPLASSSPAPVASFAWLPAAPHTGQSVSLLSTSTDAVSPITAFAWDLAGSGAFQAGGQSITTSFSTPGNHVVRLRVADANGLSSVVAETIAVSSAQLSSMRPFPIVQIASTRTRSGVRLRLLRVQAASGALISVKCRGRGCPLKSQRLIAASAKAGVVAVTFRRFQRSLPAGVILEVRISKPGQIGKYTRFAVRRSALPARSDSCLDPAGVKPMACPSS